jgi:hypothetical protein
MQNAKKGFRYTIARVDESEITGLAAAKLWIDFSKQPEGPSGSGLLSLLSGLQGLPLPREAVMLAAQVDEEMKDGLVSVKAWRDAGDADGLVALAATNNLAWTRGRAARVSRSRNLIRLLAGEADFRNGCVSIIIHEKIREHPEKTRFVDFRFNNSDGSPPETE